MTAGGSNFFAGKPVILQVLPGLTGGGVERGTIEIATAISRAGGVALVASAGGRLVPEIERSGGRHINLPLATKNPAAIWQNASRLARLIRAERVDIVHARSRAPAWSALIAARRTGAHFLTTYHGTYGEDLPFKRHYNSVMAKGERVIAISRFIAGIVKTRHGVDPALIRIIPRGVDPAVFDPDRVTRDRIERTTSAWAVPQGARVVLLPGRLSGWKGQAVLIEAVAKLGRANLCCVLVGEGHEREERALRARAKRLGVAERLRLVGHCYDMPAALARADVVVHASTEPEAFGRVVIEAQAMRRPVIASDLGGPAETVASGKTGFLVPPGDAVALAATIDRVLALGEEEQRALGERARAAVEGGYTTAAMQAATLAVYRELLGDRRTPLDAVLPDGIHF
jgi:glycosyltransferase involved in cell wall biosynthesis